MAEGIGPETSLVIIGRPVHPFRRFLTSPGRSRGKCGTNPVSGLTLSAVTGVDSRDGPPPGSARGARGGDPSPTSPGVLRASPWHLRSAPIVDESAAISG